MTNYHIKEFGSAFVVGTDEDEILVCADRNVATQIAIEAQKIQPAEIAAFHALCEYLKARALTSNVDLIWAAADESLRFNSDQDLGGCR